MKFLYILLGLLLVIAGIAILIDTGKNYSLKADKMGLKWRLLLDGIVAIITGVMIIYLNIFH